MKTILIGIMMLLSLSMAAANGPTDKQIKDFCREAGFAMRGTSDEMDKKWQALTTDAGKVFDITKIKPEQVVMLFDDGGETLSAYLRAWLEPVLEARKGENTQMAYLYWKYLPSVQMLSYGDKELAALKNLISRKDVCKHIEASADMASDVISGMAQAKGDNWQKYDMLKDVKRILAANIPDQAAQRVVEVFNAAIVSSIDAADKETLRQLALAIYQHQYDATTYTSRRKRLQKQIDYLASPFAKGTLIGNKAPDLHFLWISDGNETSLDDFKGKVVVLDFWATKCAPCIASFPELAELKSHYEGKDVVIIGVTSPQGYFVDKPNNVTENTAGHPEKEFELTPPYMKSMGMTWRVAYTNEDVMNPDYGALSIPHITIIDRNGIVRHNNVGGGNETKISLIDSLLTE